MAIGEHGSCENCPLWKKVVIISVGLLMVSPVFYRVTKTALNMQSHVVAATVLERRQ
jgi:hypothetical protein